MKFHFGDIILRTTLGFGLLLMSIRILGKQMIGQMTYYDFVTNITLGALAGALILDHHITLADLVLAISVFTFLSFVSSYISLKNRKLRKFIAGKSVELIRDGKILEKELERYRISMEHLVQQLRIKNVFDVNTVKQAFLESNGQLSVLLKPEFRPLTLGDYQPLSIPEERLPIELIIDGQVLTEKLANAGLDLDWLMQELTKNGISDTKEVAYAILTSKNTVYFDKYRDDLTIPRETDINDHR